MRRGVVVCYWINNEPHTLKIMKLLSKRIQWILLVLLFPFLGLFVWANWEEPPLSAYFPPVAWASYRVEGLHTVDQADMLDGRLLGIPGVHSCNINPQNQLAILSYNPDEVQEDRLRKTFTEGGMFRLAAYQWKTWQGDAGPQCPVPASYIEKINRLKFALSVRKFFSEYY